MEKPTKVFRELKDGDVISFEEMHPNYGRAEFSICLVYKYGKLRETYLNRVQQGQFEEFRISTPYGAMDFSATGNYPNDPRLWIFGYCKEHKASFTRFYAPDGTSQLTVYTGRGVRLLFT